MISAFLEKKAIFLFLVIALSTFHMTPAAGSEAYDSTDPNSVSPLGYDPNVGTPRGVFSFWIPRLRSPVERIPGALAAVERARKETHQRKTDLESLIANPNQIANLTRLKLELAIEEIKEQIFNAEEEMLRESYLWSELGIIHINNRVAQNKWDVDPNTHVKEAMDKIDKTIKDLTAQKKELQEQQKKLEADLVLYDAEAAREAPSPDVRKEEPVELSSSEHKEE